MKFPNLDVYILIVNEKITTNIECIRVAGDKVCLHFQLQYLQTLDRLTG